jgi:DNA-binding response OmpR family regulator
MRHGTCEQTKMQMSEGEKMQEESPIFATLRQKHPPRILIADDDAEMRALLVAALSHDYQVVEARDGVEAAELMAKAPCALIVADKNMPRMGGLELLAQVKRANEPVPVIIITAFANDSTSAGVYGQGAFLYLSKPFRMEKLKEAVRLALRQTGG